MLPSLPRRSSRERRRDHASSMTKPHSHWCWPLGVRKARILIAKEACCGPPRLSALTEDAAKLRGVAPTRMDLLDDLVRAEQKRPRERQPQGLRRLEVHDQLEACGLLDGQIGGPGTT